MILGTAGHIDHGKTALVRALTGVDTDRLPEEKRRGITIDLGFAPMFVEGVGTVAVVDVPGHEAFVRTMLAGASGIDVAILVVAADEGIMPQTREHLEILSLLGIRDCLVALTKCDLVDDEWLALVRADVESLIAPASFATARIFPVSVIDGTGVNELRSAIAELARRESARPPGDIFRMPVDRAFTMKGTGTVVTGTVWSGTVTRDATIVVHPGGKEFRVRGLQTHGRAVDAVGAGDRAAIALAGCDVSEVSRGATLVATRRWPTTREIDCIVKFNDADFRPGPRTRLRFHLGTAETGARVARTGDPAGDGSVQCRLVLDDPAVVRGADRFILRVPSPARTVGGGVVTDSHPRRRRKRPPRRFVSPDAGANADGIEKLLSDAGVEGVELEMIPIRTGLNPEAVEVALAASGAVMLGGRVFTTAVLDSVAAELAEFVRAETDNHPLEPGVSLQTVRSAIRGPEGVIAGAVDRLVSRGVIEVTGARVRPAGWRENLGLAERSLSDAILREICIHGSEPPSVGELGSKFGGPTHALLRRLERLGELEKVSEDRYYGAGVISGMIGTMRSKLEAGRIYTPAELREVLGVSRKYLIPFLEFCDRRGVTERREQGRELRSA